MDDLAGIHKSYSDSRVSFIFISRISRNKGVEEIIHASHKLVSLEKKFIVNIHGHFVDLEYKSLIYNLIAELGLNDTVLIRPYIDGGGKYNELSNSDIFLLPSYEEGCPNSVIEAMASGCFIISSDVGALSEIVKDGINGLIMDEITAKNLEEKMAYAIANIGLVREKGKSNIKYAYDNFEAESHIKNMENLYRSLV
jgi:glycosyltransferase involved in cell wall biosynthesis